MRFVLVVATLMLLAGCGTAATPGAGDPLDGRTFLSTAVTEDGQARDLVADTRIRLSFVDDQITATAGCNTIGGSYSLAAGTLDVGVLRMTQMGCPDELAEQDRWLVELLEQSPVAVVEGDELTLTAGSTSVVLLDRRVADPDRPLVGPVWVVDSLISADAVSSVPGEARASLEFRDDGTVGVLPGCNTGHGRWVGGQGTITISQVALTRMACVDERGELERAVLEVLAAPELTVHIEAARLTLMAGDKGLRLRAE